VHLVTRNWLREKGKLIDWTEKAIIRLAEVFPDHDYVNKALWTAYLPHARHVLGLNLLNEGFKERFILLNKVGPCLLIDGSYDEAEEMLLEASKGILELLGQEHPSTLTSMANLASTFWNQGRWKEAEELEVQVMERRKRVLGQEHPSTLASMNNLSWTWKLQDREDEAMRLMTECVQALKRKLGNDHPNTKTAVETLEEWQTSKRRTPDTSSATKHFKER
jgi:hypothetical protein